MPISPFGWQNSPSTATPLSAADLEAMHSAGGAYADSRIAALTTTALTPSGGDDGAVLNNALTTNCDITLGPGTFNWQTIPQLPRSATHIRIHGAGRGVTVIQLHAAAPRAFDFHRIADYDVFQNIELADFTVDANNTTGRHHVLWGTYQAGVLQQRLSFTNLKASRIDMINVVNDPTLASHRLCVWLESHHVNDAEGTQTYATSIRHEDITISGGNAGYAVTGNYTTSLGTLAVNVFIDDIVFDRCKWNPLVAPTGFYASSGFQVGEKAMCRRVRLTDCHSWYSGDVGMEFDNVQDLLVIGCTSTDAVNAGWDAYNKRQPWYAGEAGSAVASTNPDHQVNRFIDCTAIHTTTGLSSHRGWEIGNPQTGTGANPETLGTVILDGCTLHRTNTTFTAGGYAFQTRDTGVQKLVLRNFTVEDIGVNVNTTGNSSPSACWYIPTGASILEVDGLRIKLAATIAGGITAAWTGFLVGNNTHSGSNPGELKFNINNVVADVAFTTSGGSTQNGNSRLFGFGIGLDSGPTSTSGTFKRVVVNTWSGDSSSRIIWFDTAAVIPDRVDMADCDFSALTGATGTDVFFAGGGSTSGLVFNGFGNRWRSSTPAGVNGALGSPVSLTANSSSETPLTINAASGSQSADLVVIKDDLAATGSRVVGSTGIWELTKGSTATGLSSWTVTSGNAALVTRRTGDTASLGRWFTDTDGRMQWNAASATNSQDVTLKRLGPGMLQLANHIQLATAAPTYSASVSTNTQSGLWQTITVTDGNSFAVSAPANPPTSSFTTVLTIEVLNSSGGAMGVISWAAIFLFAGFTWANPANAKHRYARFEWNGSNWICTSMSSADY